jgi:hypothetical protein
MIKDNLSRSLLAGFLLALTTVGPSFAQTPRVPGAQDRINPPKTTPGSPQAPVGVSGSIKPPDLANIEGLALPGQRPTEFLQLEKRAPLKFTPFGRDAKTGAVKMVHPATGVAITPETVLNLPNGKTITARQFYDELNRLEADFNQAGYTLRQPQEIKAAVDRQLPMPDRAQLMREQAELSAMHRQVAPFDVKPNSGFTPENFATLSPENVAKFNQYYQQESLRDATRLGTLDNRKTPVIFPQARSATTPQANPGAASSAPQSAASAVPKAETVDSQRSFNLRRGDNRFGAYLSGQVATHAEEVGHTPQKKGRIVTTLRANADAGGYLFGHRINIVSTRATLTAPEEGTRDGSLRVDVMGSTILDLNERRNAAWIKTDSYAKSFDYATPPLGFRIGPISFSITAGAKGEARFGYLVMVRPIDASAWINPSVRASVYAQGGVDIWIAKVGVGVRLVLINDNLLLGGQIKLDFDSQRRPYFYQNYWADNDLEALSGHFYIYWEIFWIFRGDSTLFSWGGFRVKGRLFDYRNTTYLFEPALNAQIKANTGASHMMR